MLMMVEAEILNRVLKVVEDHIDVSALRQRNRTPVMGLRALVNEALRRELELSEAPDTTRVSGCVNCGVLNDVQHCRECGHDLDLEPVTVTEGDLEPARLRLEQERQARRQREQEELERNRGTRRRRARERDLAIYQEIAEAYRRYRSAQGEELVIPEGCGIPMAECDQCYRELQRWVQQQQDRIWSLPTVRDQDRALVEIDNLREQIRRERGEREFVPTLTFEEPF